MTGLVMSEADLQAQVIDLAHLTGWRTAHFRAGMTQSGRWVTPVAGDGVGWPDLFLARPRDGRLLAVELKSARGRPTPEQLDWLDTLRRCGVETHLWRPDDWDVIVEALS